MSPLAPRIITTTVPVDKIGEIIGPKGKMINQIQEDTGAEIAIEDDGTVYISSEGGEAAEKAKKIIDEIANPHVPEAGETYNGTVVKTTSFGAFVNLTPGTDGLLHISQIRNLADGQRIDSVEECSRKATPLRWSCRALTIVARSRSPFLASKIRNRPHHVVTIAVVPTVTTVAVPTAAATIAVTMIAHAVAAITTMIMMIARVAVVTIAMIVMTARIAAVMIARAVRAATTIATRATLQTRTMTNTAQVAKSVTSVRVAVCAATSIRSTTDCSLM